MGQVWLLAIAKWGNKQILSAKSNYENWTKFIKTTHLRLEKPTEGIQYSEKHLCLKNTWSWIRTTGICGILTVEADVVSEWGQVMRIRRIFAAVGRGAVNLEQGVAPCSVVVSVEWTVSEMASGKGQMVY